MQELDTGKMALVISPYEAPLRYTKDPLSVNSGQELKIIKLTDNEWPGWILCEGENDKQAWIPERILQIVQGKGIVREAFDARELSAMEGEIVRIEKMESGWTWATNMTNDTGWIPMRNLKLID